MSFRKLYSKYYNTVYKKKNYKLEVNYILKILNSYNSKFQNILELGSGTGAHVGFFLKKGFSVTCVEKSKEMISNFKLKSNRLKLLNKDLKKINLNKKFDLVLSLFHVINYMVKDKDVSSFFKVASKHLKKNGYLIFDTWYYPAVKFRKPEKIKKKFIFKNIQIIKKVIPEQIKKKIYKIKYFFDILDLKKNKKSSFSEIHTIRAFDIEELDRISNKFNFKKVSKFAFLKKIKPNKYNWGALLIYKKL